MIANQTNFTHSSLAHLEVYETRDLFQRHANKVSLWQHVSRKDDVIVFLNGEKTNPITLENDVMRHPEVRSALVTGQQRFEAALLMELVDPRPLTLSEQRVVVDRM
jgi:acyl-coenzyme A synthetase/AMP-(fatty) acid ligase